MPDDDDHFIKAIQTRQKKLDLIQLFVDAFEGENDAENAKLMHGINLNVRGWYMDTFGIPADTEVEV